MWFPDTAMHSTFQYSNRIFFRKIYIMLKDGEQLSLTLKEKGKHKVCTKYVAAKNTR